jgi:hypothetical protein
LHGESGRGASIGGLEGVLMLMTVIRVSDQSCAVKF